MGGGDAMLRHIILRGQSTDRFHQTRVAVGGVQCPHWVVRKGGDLDQYQEESREYGHDALTPLPRGR